MQNTLIDEEENQETTNISIDAMRTLAEELEDSLVSESAKDADSFYKNVVNKLFNKEDISTKTEYLDVRENFQGAKLELLGNIGNIPFMSHFMETFEIKRVSLQRKGRIELIKALAERNQDMQNEREERLKSLFGV